MGIAVGTALGLASGSASLVLLDGTVPTAVLGAATPGLTVVETTADVSLRRGSHGSGYPQRTGLRRQMALFRLPPHVQGDESGWGLAFLAEAAVQVLIIETSSVGTAKATSNVMPLAFAAIVITWNIAYGKRGRRQGERAVDAARARGDLPRACLRSG